MEPSNPERVMHLLQRALDSDTGAGDELEPLPYVELEELARHLMMSEPKAHTLQPGRQHSIRPRSFRCSAAAAREARRHSASWLSAERRLGLSTPLLRGLTLEETGEAPGRTVRQVHRARVLAQELAAARGEKSE